MNLEFDYNNFILPLFSLKKTFRYLLTYQRQWGIQAKVVCYVFCYFAQTTITIIPILEDYFLTFINNLLYNDIKKQRR
jgi:hypothetical protein